MALIDVGADPIDRAGARALTYTLIDYNNLANDTGILDEFQIHLAVTGANVKVGTFYGADPYFTSRDYETIGSVSAGSTQTFSGLSINVTTGDCVGIYGTSGTIDTVTFGQGGVFYDTGDNFGAGSQEYDEFGGDAISLYATGATVPVTSIKIISGTLHAEVKTVSGTPIAEAKTISGTSNVS